MTITNDKPRVLMVCSHEPTMDPRIRWEAEYAANKFDVTVLGFTRDEIKDVERSCEDVDGYRIIRMSRQRVSMACYLVRFTEATPLWLRPLLGLIALILATLLVVLEIGGRLARLALHGLRRLASSRFGSPALVAQIHRLREVRGKLMARIFYIVAIIQVQFAPAAAQFIREIEGMPIKPDVIHCNDLDTLLVGVIAKKRYGCRVVYDAHEFYPVSDPDGRWIDITVFKFIERVLIRQTDASLTVNPMLAELMADCYGLEKVHSLPNAEPWIAPSERAPFASDMQRLAAGRVKFLFQGRFSPGRGIDELIEGWAGTDPEKCALFLRGPDNIWRQRAQEMAAALGILDRNLYFLPAVTEDELVAAAAEADVGVIPYRPKIINDKYACPNKMSQYLHAGVAVLANDLPYVRSVIEEAAAGEFYSSFDVSTLAAAVNKLLSDPDAISRHRLNGQAYAKETFNWQKLSGVLYEQYAVLSAIKQA